MTTVEPTPSAYSQTPALCGTLHFRRMAAGDIRDAAEKAWCATMRAVEALVLARTGQEPGKSTDASHRLRALYMSDTDPSLMELRDRYYGRQEILHGECFYHDHFDPAEIDLSG